MFGMPGMIDPNMVAQIAAQQQLAQQNAWNQNGNFGNGGQWGNGGNNGGNTGQWQNGNQGNNGGNGGKGGWNQGNGGGQGNGGKGGGSRLCFNVRDYGKCKKKDCTFRHDMTPAELEEFGHNQPGAPNVGQGGQGGGAGAPSPFGGKKVVGVIEDEPKVEVQEEDVQGNHADFEKLEGKPNAITLTVTDRDVVMYPLGKPVLQPNGQLLTENRVCSVPAEYQMLFQRIGELVAGKAIKHDNQPVGGQGKVWLEDFIQKLSGVVKDPYVIAPPKQPVLDVTLTPEKSGQDFARLENLVTTILTTQQSNNNSMLHNMMEQNNKVATSMQNLTTTLAATPRASTSMHPRLSPGTPIFRRARKQPKVKGSGASGSAGTAAPALDHARYAALFTEDSSSDDDIIEPRADLPPFDDPIAHVTLDRGFVVPEVAAAAAAGADGGLAPGAVPPGLDRPLPGSGVGGPAAPPAAAGGGPAGGPLPGTEAAALQEREERTRGAWTAMKTIMDQYDAVLPTCKRVGANKTEWNAADIFGTDLAWMKPAKPVGPGDASRTFSPEDMGVFGSLFIEQDYANVQTQVLTKVMHAIEETKRGTERCALILASFGVRFSGKDTKKRTVLALSMAIAKNRRENPDHPFAQVPDT